MADAVDKFINIADSLVLELLQAIDCSDESYPNAGVALENVSGWLDLARSGALPGAYFPNFGISKSDLVFGLAEDPMYELEDLYVQEIRDSEHML